MRVGVDGRSLVAGGRGVAHYTAGMLGALADAGADLCVLLPRGASLAARANVVRVRRPEPSRVLYGAAAVARRPRLDRLLGGVDVVWLPAPAPVAVGADTPIVLTLHDLSFVERPQDYTTYERLWHKMARIGPLARRAARVVADTEDTARRAVALLGVPAERTVVVGAGPGEPGPVAGSAEVAAVRARYRIPERYFLFVGALEPRKGLDVVRAAGEGLDTALVLAGEGRLRGELRVPGVHVLGDVGREEKAALYAGALAVVLPSWCEGYGYPPLEGYAHGTPAIVSDLGALRETAGEGARFVPPGDVAAWAAAMRELGGDAALRAQLAAAGARSLRKRTWATCGGALYATLSDVVHTGKRSSLAP